VPGPVNLPERVPGVEEDHFDGVAVGRHASPPWLRGQAPD
jgi:hypothetical protein